MKLSHAYREWVKSGDITFVHTRMYIASFSSSLIIRDDDDMTIDGDKGRVEINLAAISTDSRELRAFPRGQT